MDNIESYFNLKNPGSFGGLNVFSKALGRPINEDIKTKLLNTASYSLHHPRRKLFKRRRVYVPYINAQWGADLAEIQTLKKSNNGYRYILCVIDIFSKKAWIEPIKNKTGFAVTKAFQKIISRAGSKPEKLQTDSGKEFYNSTFQKALSSQNIKHFSVTSEIKCGTIERFIRTIMTKIRKYMTKNNTKKFIHRLSEFESLYNRTYHRSIKMAPINVNAVTSPTVYRNLYGYEQINNKIKQHNLKIGDRVRISKLKKTFEKGYDTNYTDEIFTISKIRQTSPTMFYLIDDNNEDIVGGFYREELLKIPTSV